MPYLLEDLVVERVDLVDEGANSAAFITLYKRKEQQNTMGIKEILEKMLPEHATVVKSALDESAKQVTDITGERDTATKALEKANTDLKATNDSLTAVKSELDALKKSKAAEGADDDAIFKALPKEAQQLITDLRLQKTAAEDVVRKAKEAAAEAEAVAKAAELKALPVDQVKLVGIIKNCSPELLEVLTTINKAVEATVLGEVGKNGAAAGTKANTGNEAWDEIAKKASELAKTEKISVEKAVSLVIEENPELYKRYVAGGAN